MKCLRKALNKTRRDKIRNEVIRDMVGAKPLLQHIKQQQIKWFGHITRMPINQPALRAYNTKYFGWRARGRPRKLSVDREKDTVSLSPSSTDSDECPSGTDPQTHLRRQTRHSLVDARWKPWKPILPCSVDLPYQLD